MTETGGTPPGWYVDNAGQRRWWDGMAWTEHVDTGQAAVAAGTGYGAAAYAQQQYGQLPWPPPYYLEGGPSDFGSSIRNAIRNTFEYRGRASRSSYWWFYLAQTLMFVVAYVIFLIPLLVLSNSSSEDSASGGAIAFFVIVGIAFAAFVIWLFLVSLSLTIRRLHDTSRSGWWYLLALVPFGSLVVLVFTILESTPGPNQYNIDLTGASHSL